jgi:membrane-bound lytic murein transglycosylase B
MGLKRWFVVLIMFSVGSAGFANSDLLPRKDVQHFIRYLVAHDGFDRAQVVAALKTAQFQPQIIQSMERPYEQKNWDVYKALFLTPARVKSGIEFWQANAKTLARAEKEYGVPAEVIVAILGVETQYGKRQGEYRVLDALTTLAFYYPKRSPYFTKELREYLLLCRERQVPPTQYIGSYAGAIGQPQFMPSNYRVYAVDYAGHGKRDLVNDTQDVIGSVANFFAKHGWITHQAVAQPAQWTSKINRPVATNSKEANYSYPRLLALGVKPVSQLPHHPDKVGLIELTLNNGAEYWLAYPNFYVITRYNSSPQYALVVYLLAQQLRQQWALTVNKHHSAIG